MISNETIDDDNEILWRYEMLSNIIYAYINKSVIFDKLDMMLLINNEFISDRFYNSEKTNLSRIFQIENQFKSFNKNNIFEVLLNRILN